MSKLLLLPLLMFPAVALSAEAGLKLQLTPKEIDNKELQLEEQLKKQEVDRMVKTYPSGSMVKVDRVNPDKLFNKDGSINSPQLFGGRAEFTDKNGVKTYKKNPGAKPDHGVGLSVSVPLTEDK